MVDSIPEWAIEKARELMLSTSDDAAISPDRGGMWHAAFARYIAANEEPPVDPLAEALADMVADGSQFAAGLRKRLADRGLKIVEASDADR